MTVAASMQYPSPFGTLTLAGDDQGLTGLWMDSKIPSRLPEPGQAAVFPAAVRWLDLYFQGKPSPIDFPLNPEGTPFQHQVWEILLTIPFGKTMTYGQIAAMIRLSRGGAPMSAQAVGGAVGRNPISILIPCHRIIGAGGKLTGYSGGLDKKIWLLRHEGSLPEESL